MSKHQGGSLRSDMTPASALIWSALAAWTAPRGNEAAVPPRRASADSKQRPKDLSPDLDPRIKTQTSLRILHQIKL